MAMSADAEDDEAGSSGADLIDVLDDDLDVDDDANSDVDENM